MYGFLPVVIVVSYLTREKEPPRGLQIQNVPSEDDARFTLRDLLHCYKMREIYTNSTLSCYTCTTIKEIIQYFGESEQMASSSSSSQPAHIRITMHRLNDSTQPWALFINIAYECYHNCGPLFMIN